MSFENLKKFLEEKPASHRAISHLKEGVQIGIVVPGSFEAAYLRQGNLPKLVQGPALSPDVVFYLKPEAVQNLLQHPGDDIGDFGVSVLKEYAKGTIKLHVQGGLWNLTKNGYLGIMTSAGPSFAKALAASGVSGITKIFSHISDLRKKPDL